MAANDAFTAGVRPGGLTNSTEIRLLLCYLVKNAGPITRTEIENALMEEALVNYFEIGSCLDDIARQQLVTADATGTPSPTRAAKWRRSWPTTCPAVCGKSGRRRAAQPDLGAQGSRVQRPHQRKSRRPLLRALSGEGSGQRAVLSGHRHSRPAEREMVKKQFILKGNEIYQMLITKLTEEENSIKVRCTLVSCSGLFVRSRYR